MEWIWVGGEFRVEAVPWMSFTYWQLKNEADDEAAQPIEDQKEEVVSGTGFVVVGLQSERVIVEEITVQHEMETGGRIQWIIKHAGD